MIYEKTITIGGVSFMARVGDPDHYDPYGYEYRWGSLSIADDLYRGTGFSLDFLPVIWQGRVNTETGEITHEWERAYLSGKDFKKFQRDAKVLLKSITALGAHEKGFPKSYRPKYSSISDPVADGTFGKPMKSLPSNLVEVVIGHKSPHSNKPRNAIECHAHFNTTDGGVTSGYKVAIAYNTTGSVIKANCDVYAVRNQSFKFKGKGLEGPFTMKSHGPYFSSKHQ